MSRIVVSTRELVGLLADAVLTASGDKDAEPALRAVVLHTERAEITLPAEDGGGEEETVRTDALVATSTDDSTMVGQGHTGCEGQLPRPLLLPVPDVKDLVRVFMRLGKSAGSLVAHQTILEVTGETLTISEDPQYYREGRSMTITLVDPKGFPKDLPARWEPARAGEGEDRGVVVPARGCGLSPRAHEILGKVGKRRGMDAVYYRDPRGRGVIVEIGFRWHGVFQSPVMVEDVLLCPIVPVFTPPWENTRGD